jgi:hypothetical protein
VVQKASEQASSADSQETAHPSRSLTQVRKKRRSNELAIQKLVQLPKDPPRETIIRLMRSLL